MRSRGVRPRSHGSQQDRWRLQQELGGGPQILQGRALVTEWMKETQAQRSAAKVKLDRSGQTSGRMSKDDIMNIVEALGNIADVLHHADPRDKAEIYKGLALRLRYQPAQNTVRAEVNLDPHRSLNHPYGEMVRVRGGTRTIPPSGTQPLVLSTSFTLDGR